MKERYFIYTTQKRFIKNILNSWLNRETAAAFFYDSRCNWDLLFTLAVSIYHWISLDVQNNILVNDIKSFSFFYDKHLDFIPSVILFEDSIPLLNEHHFNVYQSYDWERLTFPYYKIKDIWSLKKIYKVFDISIDDIVYSEHNIWDLIEWNDRFFSKSFDNIWDFFKCKIIDKKQIYSFCNNLAKKILNSKINSSD